MRSKTTLFLLILVALVLSSMMFTCSPFSPISLAAPIASVPIGTVHQPGTLISAGSHSDITDQLVPVAGQEYWGSSQSDKFHYPSCRWARAIHSENLIVFKSKKEALDSGYVPCKVCRP